MVVVIALMLQRRTKNRASAEGPPNHLSVSATHHCTAVLWDPWENIYHGVEAQFWTINLFGDRKFPASPQQ